MAFSDEIQSPLTLRRATGKLLFEATSAPTGTVDAVLTFLSSVSAEEASGLWYFDPSVCDVYTDTAGTGRAGAGDNLARIDDYFGNGWSFQQGTAGLRPLLESVNGGLYVRHQSDILSLAADPNLEIGQTSDGSTYGFHFQDDYDDSDLNNLTYMGGDDTSINSNRLLLRRGNNGAGGFEVQSYCLDTSPSFESAYTPADPDGYKVVRVRNKSNLPDRGIVIWENGVLVNNQTNGGDDIDYQVNVLHLGQRDGGTEIHPGFRWSAFFFADRSVCSDETIEGLEVALATRN